MRANFVSVEGDRDAGFDLAGGGCDEQGFVRGSCIGGK